MACPESVEPAKSVVPAKSVSPAKSVGPSMRVLRWTQYAFLVVAGIIALLLLLLGDWLDKATGSVLFWRVLTWLRTLRRRG
jgi:hypothetical protein